MSRPRLSRQRPQRLSADQRRLYDEIAGGPRASGLQSFPLTDDDGALTGPFNAMLLSPPVGAALQAVGAAVRYGSVLSARVREMAILLVAAHWDSDFERYAHQAVGRSIGLTAAELAAVGRGEVPAGVPEAEAAALVVVHALLRRADLDDDEYHAAVRELGERPLFELITLVGYYATLAVQLRVFRADGVPSEPPG